MRRSGIDFAPASLMRSWASSSLALRIALGLACLLCGLGAARVDQLSERLTTTHVHIDELRKNLRVREPMAQPVAAFHLSKVESEEINHAIRQLNLPWRDIFDSIESATPDSIATLDLTPDAQSRKIRMMAEAKTAEDMIAYIEQLKRSEMLESVILTHHETNVQDANRPIRFRLDMRWKDMNHD